MSSTFENIGDVQQDNAAEIERRENNLEKLVDFFDADTRIKQTMKELSPYDNEETSDYSDRLYRGLGEMTYDLKTIMNNYYPSEEIDDTLEKIQEKTIHASGSLEKLTDVYKTNIINMNQNFVEDVKKETVGYYISKNEHSLDKKVTSINEALHLIHSSITNNEYLLQNLPVLETSNEKDGFVLFGQENPTAKAIFDSVSHSEINGHTDVIGIKDRTLMMIRDYGHATTLDIQKENNKYYVNYFIPKVCNVEKINNLPGLQKLATSTSDKVSGTFEVDSENEAIGDRVTEFISKIPTDSDVVY